jgi:hypothetical protein
VTDVDAQYFEELSSRWVCGEPLTAAEEQRLLQWLQDRPEARGKLLADEELESLLRCLPRLQDTAEGFVQDCLRRIPVAAASSAIVAPPVVMVPCPPQPGRGAVRGRRWLAGGAGRWAAAAACCSAVLLLCALGWRLLAPGRRVIEANHPVAPAGKIAEPALAARKPSRPAPERAFATLAESAGASWETPRFEGDRLADGILKLTRGTAELRFDKGTVARLTGPAVLELRSADEVFLQRGSVASRVPPPAVGFAVVTPLSRIVDLGTEFDVSVDGAGATQALVRRGRVSLTPQRGQEQPATPIELAAGALDHAVVSVPDVAAAALPVITVASGGEGRFLGLMSTDGKTVGFHSPEAFRTFQTQALKQLHEAPDEFGRRWSGLVAAFDRGVNAVDRGANAAASAVNARPPADAAHRETSPAKAHAPAAAAGVAAGARGIAAGRAVEVHENGRTISITDNKESGITVTVTETQGGKKRTTEVRAANAAELARKNPDAHRMYRQYFHPRPKTGKAKW